MVDLLLRRLLRANEVEPASRGYLGRARSKCPDPGDPSVHEASVDPRACQVAEYACEPHGLWREPPGFDGALWRGAAPT
ncbi:hypothetical protein BE04_18825 [Sorangium cellulosum]|uniref:Uncharacterized protein n=1 Tax=Sorangium cellulosum TaxID=56 RepID=A0A150P878_SORCE|nr:hypothetical protein BE04_18825 [Sorangium cellulosum]